MRPNSLIVRKYLARGAGLWLGVRLMASAAFVMAESDPLNIGPTATVLIIVAASTVSLIDVHIRRERALLENLAVSRQALIGLFAGPAVAGELALLFVAALRR